MTVFKGMVCLWVYSRHHCLFYLYSPGVTTAYLYAKYEKNQKQKTLKFVLPTKQRKYYKYFEIFQVKIRILKSKLNFFTRLANPGNR